MKYLLLIVVLLLSGLAIADTVRNDAVNRVYVSCTKVYHSVPSTYNGITMANELAEKHGCKTQYQGNVYIDYVAGSSSSKSSASSSKSSTVPVSGNQKLSICAPNEREGHGELSLDEMIAYKFRIYSSSSVFVESEQEFKGVECDIYVLSIPQGSLRVDVAAVAKGSPDSAYVAVEF